MGLLSRSTSATPVFLTQDESINTNGNVATSSMIIFGVQQYTVAYFQGTCVAHSDEGDDSKAWTIKGILKKSGSTSNFFQVTVTAEFASSGASAWDLEVTESSSSDNSLMPFGYRGLKVKGTGEASHTIAWFASFDITEMNHTNSDLSL